MSIEFTQFMRPNGRRKQEVLDNVPDDVQVLVDKLVEMGAKFEIEVLTTGDVHGDVSIPDEDEDGDDDGVLANFIHANGPGLHEAIYGMVREAAKLKGVGQ